MTNTDGSSSQPISSFGHSEAKKICICIIKLQFSNSSHQGHVQQLTSRIGRTIGTAYVRQGPDFRNFLGRS